MGERRVGGATRTVGVIGWPVEHSLSPAIHNAAFAALGLDWVYVPLPVEPGKLPEALRGLPGLGFAGANVTMPHKTESAALAGTLSDDAKRLRSVNTFVIGPSGLVGHNTDTPGFERFLRKDAGFDPAGKTALIFGAGGAARACALALARGGLAKLTIAVREPSRAADTRAMLYGEGVEVEALPFGAATGVRADFVLNATPLGSGGEDLPVSTIDRETVVVDLLSWPASTPLLRAAKQAGASAFGGLGLLLHQAALSFELWTGQQPPMDIMSAAGLSALAELA